MSPQTPSRAAPARRAPASSARIFAALGDRTRLSILERLGDGQRQSISRLTHGTRLTRQAVTKHLAVLRKAGLVRHTRRGREQLFELCPSPIESARETLDAISRSWDTALARLKSFVES